MRSKELLPVTRDIFAVCFGLWQQCSKDSLHLEHSCHNSSQTFGKKSLIVCQVIIPYSSSQSFVRPYMNANANKSQEYLSDNEILLLLALKKKGGKGERYRVLNEIGKGAFKKLLTNTDLEELKSGNRARYEANLSWASDRLKKKGYLRRDSPRGLWEITDEGTKKLLETFQQK